MSVRYVQGQLTEDAFDNAKYRKFAEDQLRKALERDGCVAIRFFGWEPMAVESEDGDELIFLGWLGTAKGER